MNAAGLGYLIVLNYPVCDRRHFSGRWRETGCGRLRILYIAVDTPIPGTHGGGVHVLELCRALSRRGHDVHVVAPASELGQADTANADVHNQTTAEPRQIQVSRPKRFLEWTAVNEVRRIAERVQPDVLVERFYTFGGAGIWAAKKLGLPAVLEVNSPARPYPGSWRDMLDRVSLFRPVDRWRRPSARLEPGNLRDFHPSSST